MAGWSPESVRASVQNFIANADALSETPGGAPYRRKLVTFKNVFDKALGADKVQIDKVTTDKSDFEKRFDPQHPAADKDGYVQPESLPEKKTFLEDNSQHPRKIAI